MKKLAAVISLFLLSSCTSLLINKDDSNLVTTGKVVARTVMCMAALCVHELILFREKEKENNRKNFEKYVNSWKGRSEDELISAWGPPHSSYQYSNGVKDFRYQSQQISTTETHIYQHYCEISFASSKNMIITEAKWEGKCPRMWDIPWVLAEDEE